jgi:hypothetical protein
VQVELVVPVQVPPPHSKEVAAGLQLALSVADAPAVTMAGLAVSVHCGGAAFALWAKNSETDNMKAFNQLQ